MSETRNDGQFSERPKEERVEMKVFSLISIRDVEEKVLAGDEEDGGGYIARKWLQVLSLFPLNYNRKSKGGRVYDNGLRLHPFPYAHIVTRLCIHFFQQLTITDV